MSINNYFFTLTLVLKVIQKLPNPDKFFAACDSRSELTNQNTAFLQTAES